MLTSEQGTYVFARGVHRNRSEMVGNMKNRVFITYSYDNLEHKSWVANFAEQLSRNEIDVTLDLHDAGVGVSLPQFMEASVRDSLSC